jgi:hypothetical protein
MIMPNIPDDWTPREALAVYEFIDAIREAIWTHYNTQLIELLSADRSTNPEDWECAANTEDLDDELTF